MEEGRGDVKEVIIEEFIDFDSRVHAPHRHPERRSYPLCPPIGHVQKGGDYRESWQPFQIPEEALKKAQHIAGEVTKALTGARSLGRRVLPEQAGRSHLLRVESSSTRYRYGNPRSHHQPERV